MEPFCMAGLHTNNLPTPTELPTDPTKNQYGEKAFLFWGESKIGLRSSTQNLHWKCNHGGRFLENVPIFDINGLWGLVMLGFGYSDYAAFFAVR
jgi:hypothetical protein